MIILNCGVRQDGVLSPVLFAVYVNSIIEKLGQLKEGCRLEVCEFGMRDALRHVNK